MLQTDLFAAAPSAGLAGFWTTSIAEHVVAMAAAREDEIERARFAHSPIVLCDLTVTMLIGPAGRRGLSPEDWRRLLDHLRERDGGIDIVALTLCAFRAA